MKKPFFTLKELQQVSKDSDIEYRLKYLFGLNAALLEENGKLKRAVKLLTEALDTLKTETQPVFYEMDQADDEFLQEFLE